MLEREAIHVHEIALAVDRDGVNAEARSCAGVG
jgi:hypothetical protein